MINKQGWILTAGHLIEIIRQHQQSSLLHSGYRDNVIKFEQDKTASKLFRKKGVRTFHKPQTSSVRNYSVWWGIDNLRLTEAKILPHADLALGRLEPFDPATVTHYPTFKNPDDGYLPGTSLCKLGFPLHQIIPKFDEKKDTFTLPPGAVPLPGLPLDGIFTRIVHSALPGNSNEQQSAFIETSTPSLIGMIGGPVFDTDATVWGIQSHTMHHNLNFRAVVREGSAESIAHQFLNTGLAVHTAVIRDFLEREKIDYCIS